MRVVALIPARSGSRRVPEKNFRPLQGRSLLLRATQVARAAGLRTVVSTDKPDVARIHVEEGVEVLKRPSQLSNSDALMEDVVDHAVESLHLTKNDFVLLLQPTSPLRTTSSLLSFLRDFKMLKPSAESAFSVTEDNQDFWLRHDDTEVLRVRDLLPKSYQPRQTHKRVPLLRENGLYYLVSVGFFRDWRTLISKESVPIATPTEEDLDINCPEDWRLAELLLLRRT